MVREIKVTFTPVEEELYQWLLSKASMRNKYRRGISEFIKDILWAIYLVEKIDPMRKWMFIVKELLNSARCDVCGGRLAVRNITPDCVELFCRRCDEQNKVEGTKRSEESDQRGEDN
jgi:hypothetical protein